MVDNNVSIYHSCYNQINRGIYNLFYFTLDKCSSVRGCCSYLSNNFCCRKNKEQMLCSVCHDRCCGCLKRFLSEFNCNLDDLEGMDSTKLDTVTKNALGVDNNIIDNVIHSTGISSTGISETCMLCSENLSGAVIMPCMHSHFCYSCIEILHEKNGNCPTCREKIADIVQCI